MPLKQRDHELIQIVDAAMAEAARKSGSWLVCRPGCASCCLGLFPISPLDAMRLRRGLADLTASDPERCQTMVFDNQCRVVNDPDGELRRVLLT